MTRHGVLLWISIGQLLPCNLTPGLTQADIDCALFIPRTSMLSTKPYANTAIMLPLPAIESPQDISGEAGKCVMDCMISFLNWYLTTIH